jgi:hypothetical protein
MRGGWVNPLDGDQFEGGPMAICPECGMSFAYTETHSCAGRDRTKIWYLVSVVGGAALGGPLGHQYGLSLVRQACDKPDASNLCGFFPWLFAPVFVILGAGVGVFVAALVAMAVLAKMKT